MRFIAGKEQEEIGKSVCDTRRVYLVLHFHLTEPEGGGVNKLVSRVNETWAYKIESAVLNERDWAEEAQQKLILSL